MEQLLSVEGAAHRLGGSSKWTVHAWLSHGKLQCTKERYQSQAWAPRCQESGAEMTDLSVLVVGVPDAVAIFLVLFVVVTGLLIFYALRNKGDVRAEFSHGSTMFRLEAKERPSAKSRRRP